MNLNPRIWGPHAWFFLDSVILSLPNRLNNEQKKIYKDFFTSLQHILPCQACREHYKENLKKYPLTDKVLSSKDNMIIWILSVHNNVKKDSKKIPISIKQFFEYYDKQYDEKRNKKVCNFKYYISIIIILILILIIIYKMRS